MAMTTKRRRGGVRLTKTQKRIIAGTAAVAATVGGLYALYRKRKSLKATMKPRVQKLTPEQRETFVKESHKRKLPGKTADEVVERADEAVREAQRAAATRRRRKAKRGRTRKRAKRKRSSSGIGYVGGAVGVIVLGVLAAYAVARGEVKGKDRVDAGVEALIPIAELSSPASEILKQMIDVWEDFRTIESWKSIYNLIPKDTLTEIVGKQDPQWGDFGSVQLFSNWMLQNVRLLNTLFEIKTQGYTFDMNVKAGYVHYATIVNTGAHYITYVKIPQDNTRCWKFNAQSTGPNVTEKLTPSGKMYEVQFVPELHGKENIPTGNKNEIPKYPEMYDLYIRTSHTSLVNEIPEHIDVTNDTNACWINSVWYAWTCFRPLRDYLRENL